MTEVERPVNVMAMGHVAAKHKEATVEPARTKAEILQILEKDSIKLHELNPLLHTVDFARPESVDLLKHTIYKKMIRKDWAIPTIFEPIVIMDKDNNAHPRIIARFETPTLSEKQIKSLEKIVKNTYNGQPVRTRKDIQGHDVPSENYPFFALNEEVRSKTGGWYMGPDLSRTNALHKGLLVFKDFGPINKQNFTKDDDTAKKYIVEVREGDMFQTDIAAFILQVSQVLANKKVTDRGQLLYESYYDLIRNGIKKTDGSSVYGMERQMSAITRGLLTPLASPDLSRGLNVEPQSVLMVGVPGTGKTLIAEQLLNSETGLFILPIDPIDLQKQLFQDKDKQKTLIRIADVAHITGRKVILHIDDIENMAGDDKSTNSAMLNLMAGVQESGFYIIASTNKPEKIDTALLQPQRFGIMLHCGLQDENARYEIGKIHAPEKSENLDIDLFPSLKFREIILREVARQTPYFTPRYSAGIATIAKYNLMERVKAKKGKGIGLKEKDLVGFYYTLDDWENALKDVKSVYDAEDVRKRDEALKNFVNKRMESRLGFPTKDTAIGHVFSKEVIEEASRIERAALLGQELAEGKTHKIN